MPFMSLLVPLPPASIGVEVSSPPPRALSRGTASMCGSSATVDDFASSAACSSFFGIRGSATSVRGTPADEGVGIMFSSEGEQFARAGMITIHGSHRIAIGGGGAGFEGALLGGFAGGLRAPIGENHGPLLRAGVFGYVRGNNGFYGSLLELPQL